MVLKVFTKADKKANEWSHVTAKAYTTLALSQASNVNASFLEKPNNIITDGCP
jgi:hypothetical protein